MPLGTRTAVRSPDASTPSSRYTRSADNTLRAPRDPSAAGTAPTRAERTRCTGPGRARHRWWSRRSPARWPPLARLDPRSAARTLASTYFAAPGSASRTREDSSPPRGANVRTASPSRTSKAGLATVRLASGRCWCCTRQAPGRRPERRRRGVSDGTAGGRWRAPRLDSRWGSALRGSTEGPGKIAPVHRRKRRHDSLECTRFQARDSTRS